MIQIAASIGCLIVWAALSLAYLRFWYWYVLLSPISISGSDCIHRQRKYGAEMRGITAYRRFAPESTSNKAHTVLMSFQPVPAIIALFGCLVIFAFCSATWWYSDATAPKIFIAYAAQMIVLIIFGTLKIIRIWGRGKLWVHERVTQTRFTKKLDAFIALIKEK